MMERLMYVSTLLLSFHYAFVVYVNSSFLSKFFSQENVGILYTAGAALNIFIFLYLAKVLRRTGNYRLTLSLILLEAALILGLAFLHKPYLIAAFFILHHAIFPLIAFDLDIFLESVTRNRETGTVRGLFMTAANAAFVVSPLAVSFLAGGGGFSSIYSASVIFLLPLFVIILVNLKFFRDTSYRELNIPATARALFRNPNIYRIFMANFLLQFFYSWMVIYTPIYLQEAVGFTLKETLAIFSIMLLPFLLFELPLGRLADSRTGEKEFLAAGFITTAFFTALMAFVSHKNFALWAAILFMTRVGASAVEIMTESYFFKQVSTADASIISLFRSARPLAYIISPLAAGILLSLPTGLPTEGKLFVVLGLLMLVGVYYAARLKDTSPTHIR